MTKKIKKLAGAAIAAAVLMFAVAFAPRVSYAASATLAPSYANGIRHQNRDFSPSEIKRVIQTATGQQLAVGQGFLDAICPFGGTLGKYSMALDSGANASVLNPDDLSLAISPYVYTAIDSTSAGSNHMSGCWVPPVPVPFVNGLVGIQSHNGHSTLYLIHCSDGSNPCTL